MSIQPDDIYVGKLLKGLNSKVESRRVKAVEIISQLKIDQPQLISTLRRIAFQDPDSAMKLEAVRALWALGRLEAVIALCFVGPQTREAKLLEIAWGCIGWLVLNISCFSPWLSLSSFFMVAHGLGAELPIFFYWPSLMNTSGLVGLGLLRRWIALGALVGLGLYLLWWSALWWLGIQWSRTGSLEFATFGQVGIAYIFPWFIDSGASGDIFLAFFALSRNVLIAIAVSVLIDFAIRVFTRGRR